MSLRDLEKERKGWKGRFSWCAQSEIWKHQSIENFMLILAWYRSVGWRSNPCAEHVVEKWPKSTTPKWPRFQNAKTACQIKKLKAWVDREKNSKNFMLRELLHTREIKDRKHREKWWVCADSSFGLRRFWDFRSKKTPLLVWTRIQHAKTHAIKNVRMSKVRSLCFLHGYVFTFWNGPLLCL